MKTKILIALLCAVLSVGCCSQCRQKQKNAKPLTGTTWHLVQMGGQDLQLADDSFNLMLGEDGSIAGIAACNRLLGTYTTTPKYGISFGQVGTTMMLCPKNDVLEGEFVQMLGGITHYDIDFDTLILLQDGAIKALLKAQN
ncbi:MAG: META domain-containing protein [Alistipes sp.]|jgi:putative lipoprotein|nr:META domain-containing protein [Alistipes sp.]